MKYAIIAALLILTSCVEDTNKATITSKSQLAVEAKKGMGPVGD